MREELQNIEIPILLVGSSISHVRILFRSHVDLKSCIVGAKTPKWCLMTKNLYMKNGSHVIIQNANIFSY